MNSLTGSRGSRVGKNLVAPDLHLSITQNGIPDYWCVCLFVVIVF